MDAAQYLRKSRMEEGMDTEEVLSKHRKALAEYAAAHGARACTPVQRCCGCWRTWRRANTTPCW